MLRRVYSILGTLLLLLCVVSPAFAAGKGKKKNDDAAAAEQSERKQESIDSLLDRAVSKDASDRSAKKLGKKSAKKRKKKKAKDEDEDKASESNEDTAGSTDENANSSADQGAMPNPDVWEKPPVEEEKPKPKPVAPPPVKVGDGRPWSAAIEAGWGMKTDRRAGGFSADPYGLSAGLRGGYEFDFQLYVGLYFNWYLGSSVTGMTQNINLPTSTAHANYWQFGADVGYDAWVGSSVIIRPSMQLGEAIAIHDELGRTQATGDFMVGPGLTVVHPWDNLFVAGELRGNIVTGDGVAALLIAAQFGLRFTQ